jgi:opine dehydrogenase
MAAAGVETTAAQTAVAVLGAGNGGCAAAADLSRRGFAVRLYGRPSERLNALREHGGVGLAGVIGDGFVPVGLITDELERAIDGAEVIVLTIPSSGLEHYARALVPLLEETQVVMLNPGHMGGSLFIAQIARELGCPVPRLCETTTLTYACRMTSATDVTVFGLSSNLLFAALPASATDELYERVSPLFGALTKAGSVLETGLQDLNAVEHPAQALLNTGWLEHTKGDYYFYFEGTTPSVARVIEAVDRERMALAAAVGVPTQSFVDYFHRAGYTSEEAARTGSVYQAMQASEPNRWIKGPPGLDHRYVHEDVGWGLVPWIHLGRVLGVATPTLEALTVIASVANGIDYLREGLTLERLGMDGLDAAGIVRYVELGVSDHEGGAA